ncbi:MAG: UvrD-helicase domain-containing protein [Candidatus Obscuribacter sp.]|nr:UvrD-helicase domain-containing protein [Candidatus Obscuribacter sp.]
MLTEEQNLAVMSVEKNVLVAAGAGSGKTHVLVERYVEILRRNSDVTLANIIAVTYTRKAAAEMRSRLKGRFMSLSQDPSEIALGLNQRWRQMMLEVDSARIGTIHSLCESILKSYPSDCGIDPQFKVLEELDIKQLLDKSIDDALREVIAKSQGTDSAVIGGFRLEHQLLMDFSFEDVKASLNKLIRGSTQLAQTMQLYGLSVDQELDCQIMQEHALTTLHQVQRQALDSLLSSNEFIDSVNYLQNYPHSDPGNKLELARKETLGLLAEATEASDVAEKFKILAYLGATKIGNIGGSKPESANLRKCIAGLRSAIDKVTGKLPAGLVESDQRAFECVIGMLGLYRLAFASYQAKKAELGAVDFNDIIELTILALSKPDSRSRAFFQERLRALLVDEFQDTNDMQVQLLSLMAGEHTRLFLIGDDKQSIYKFQGADVATFNKWKEKLQSDVLDLQGQSLVTKLTASFRSHPEVVAFVNAVFCRLFDKDPRVLPYVAAFEALSPARQIDGLPLQARVELIQYGQEDDDNTSPEVFEAMQVARWIRLKIKNKEEIQEKNGASRPIEYRDFAVLLGRNKDFSQFEQVFASQGIPFVVSGGSGFLRRQEVYDFECLFRFLENPQDSHSLLAVLRSPFCALSDDLIHGLKSGGKGDLWSLLLQAAVPGKPGYAPLKKAAQTLRKFLDYAALLPLSQLVQKIVEQTSYDLTILAAPDGQQRSRNVWKIVYMASEDDHMSCGEFAQKLSLLREFGVRESEAPLDSGNSVRLMTVHASKGLEFAAVALPVLGAEGSRRTDRLILHPGYGIAFNTARQEEDEAPTWYQVASYLDKQMDSEERKRLLYVAMTRARDHLAMFIRDKGRNVVTYRKMICDTLKIDEGGALEVGARQNRLLRVADQIEAPYALSYSLDAALIALPEELKSKSAIDVDLNGGSGSSLGLLEELEISTSYPDVNELGLSRITSRDSAILSAVKEQPLFDRNLFSAKFLGLFFHALMEHLPRSGRRVDTAYVRDIAVTQGFHMAHGPVLNKLVQEGQRLLEIYYQSRLCELLSDADRRFSEATYLMLKEDSIVNRRPDLIFETKGGDWYLVDFKTDMVSQQSIQTAALKHSQQVNTYVQELNRLSSINIKPHIYFAQLGILYPV